jgi:hypothetical protein
MMEMVEKEMEIENERNRDWNEVPENEIDDIPERDIIKEEDTGTDMSGFESYLRKIYGERLFTKDT